MIERGKRVNGDKFWQMGSALIVTALLFISSNAVAQVTKITTKSGAMIGKTQPKASMVVPDARPKVEEALPAGATVIYSNFGTGNSLYDGGEGWTEAGAEANDFPITEAMAFTPDANYNVIRVDVAVTYVQGTNGMTLVLAEDNGGIPGKVLGTETFTNLPDFGTCCAVETKLAPSSKLELKSGQTYWLYPLPADTTSYLVWNFDTTSLGGNGAVSTDGGSTWTPTTFNPFGAFDFYGKTIGN